MSETTIDDRQQVIADLQAARGELVRRGRCVGDRVNHDGQVCALGAVAVAIVDNFDELYVNSVPTEAGTMAWCRALRNPRIEAVVQSLIPHVPDSVYAASEHSIAHFNDCRTTADQDVLNLFDKALAELGGLA